MMFEALREKRLLPDENLGISASTVKSTQAKAKPALPAIPQDPHGSSVATNDVAQKATPCEAH